MSICEFLPRAVRPRVQPEPDFARDHSTRYGRDR